LRIAAVALMVAVAFCLPSFCQESSATLPKATVEQSQEPSSQVPSPKPQDVTSIDGILAAIYDVISGPAGGRDWSRFRSLFLPQARLTTAGKNPDGTIRLHLLGVEDYVKVAGGFFAKEPFYEKPIVNRVEQYGNVAQVFSSYESHHAPGDAPFERGINSIQLLNDSERWWVVSILWDSERADNPLPREFAEGARIKTKKGR
jgi:hypothetical protein